MKRTQAFVFARRYLKALSITGLHKTPNDSKINCKGLGSKRWWLIRDTISSFGWKD
jgi:hypothetical protein